MKERGPEHPVINADLVEEMLRSNLFANRVRRGVARLDNLYAEAGFVVYFNEAGNRLIYSKLRLGTPQADSAETLYDCVTMIGGDYQGASVPMEDDLEELRNQNPHGDILYRVADFHTHPSGCLTPSGEDLITHDDCSIVPNRFLDVTNVVHVPQMMGGIVTRRHVRSSGGKYKTIIRMFGLRPGGPLSTEYQTVNSRMSDSEVVDRMWKSGFWVVDAEIRNGPGNTIIWPNDFFEEMRDLFNSFE